MELLLIKFIIVIYVKLQIPKSYFEYENHIYKSCVEIYICILNLI